MEGLGGFCEFEINLTRARSGISAGSVKQGSTGPKPEAICPGTAGPFKQQMVRCNVSWPSEQRLGWLAEEGHDRGHSTMHLLFFRQSKLGENRVGVLLHGRLRYREAGGDGSVGLALGHLAQRFHLA